MALRAELAAALGDIPGIQVYPSDANFVLVRVPVPATLVFDELLRDGVLVKDVSRPGLLEGCLLITVGTAAENDRCVRALRKQAWAHPFTRQATDCERPAQAAAQTAKRHQRVGI